MLASLFSRPMGRLSAFLFFLSFSYLLSAQPPVVINEVLFRQDETSVFSARNHDWIEIYNPDNQAAAIGGWILVNQNGDLLFTFPAIDLPMHSYLVVHFSTGVDDLDFSDDQGHLYTGDPNDYDALLSEQDALALFDETPGQSGLVDFVSWNDETTPYVEGALDLVIQILGLWQEPVGTLNTAAETISKRKPVWIGTSIGRDQNSNDTDQPRDWGNNGGQDASYATPGDRNFTSGQLQFTEADPAGEKPWTLLLYMSGDNILERDLIDDLDELSAFGSTANVNVVVQADFSTNYGDVEVSLDNGISWDHTSTTYRGRLLNDTEQYHAFFDYPTGSSPDLGEVNMGDPGSLSDFIQWASANYPAQKFGLILWSGGGGWKFSMLDNGDQDELHMHELTTALNDGGLGFELIGFDQPLMATAEVAWQAAPFANYMVASEASISEKGFPYNLALGTLNLNPSMDGGALAQAIVSDMQSFHASGDFEDPYYAVSAIDLGAAFTQLTGQISTMAEELSQGIDHNSQLLIRSELENAHNLGSLWGDVNYIDLRDFASRINDSGIPAAYKTHAADVAAGVDQVVLSYQSGSQHEAASGLSIYFPYYQSISGADWGNAYDEPAYSYKTSRADGQLVRYSFDPDDGTPYADPINHPLEPAPGFRFAQDFHWDEFLHRYYEPYADAGNDVTVYVGEQVILSGAGSTDADGIVDQWIWDFDATVDSSPASDYDKDGIFNEPSDDADGLGKTVPFPTNTPGQYIVVLTVWDDHNSIHPTHWETDQDTVIVTIFDNLLISDILVTPITCNGQENGTAEALVDGGAPPYTFSWSNGETGSIITGLGPGIYSVTVTDSLGMTATSSVEIIEPDPLATTLEVIQPVCPGDSTGSITIFPEGGVAPYEIYWTVGVSGPSLTNVPPGTYYAIIIDANGCLFNQNFEMDNLDTIPPVLTASDATVSLNPVSGSVIIEPILFSVMVSDNCAIDGLSVSPLQLDCSNLGPNTITISAIDNSGNITSLQVTATIVDDSPPMLSPEDITVSLGIDGTVVVDPGLLEGSSFDNCGIVTYSLDNDTYDCSNLGQNAAILSAEDGSGNVSTAAVLITVVDDMAPVVVTQDISVMLDENGFGALAPGDVDNGSYDNCGIESMTLSQSEFTCDDITNGDPIAVDLTLIDVNGNTATGTALVTVVDPFAPEITCPGDITVNFCQPVVYDEPTATDNCSAVVDQTGGLGSGAIFPFGTTTETYVATDPYGNETTCSFVVTVENDFIIDANITDVSCNGLADGSVDLTVSGGTPPYLFFWDGGMNSNLSTGIYQVTIYDSNGCESIQTYVVNEPEPLEAHLVGIQNETNGQSNGGFTLFVEGGTQPYSFEGTTFSDTLEAAGYPAGTYQVFITDANDCEVSLNITIENVSGTSEPEVLQQFRLFPNPAADHAVADIRFLQPTWVQLSLVDATGRTLQSWAPVVAPEYTFQLDLQGLAPGVYLLKLNVDGDTVVRRLVKE
ncbi:MAG: lamin tail domain-containing protein [Lewinellaceae bacterium]|nr:lamin tail domain-containing protein [Lewinellaceae bacterium]